MNASEEIIRLVLADDDSIMREGIRAILREASDIQIVGEAQDGLKAQQLAAQLRPRILLLDWQMPGPPPAEVVCFVRAHCPETITLVLTGHDRDAYLAEMIDAGAAGFLIKNETIALRLIEAIRRAARGTILFDAEQSERAQRWRETVDAKWRSLTDRERQVLMLIVRGKTDREIADDLSIKLKTVNNHISNILDKLAVVSRTEAAVWVMKEGFIDQDGINQDDVE